MTIEKFNLASGDESVRLSRLLAMVLQIKSEVLHMELELLEMSKQIRLHHDRG